MIYIIFIYFIVAVFAIICFYGTGFFILKALRIHFSNVEENSLIILLAGITSYIIVFSIYKTYFATLNSILLILLIFIWFEYRKEKTFKTDSVYKKSYFLKIIEIISVYFVFFFLRLIASIDFEIYPFFHCGRDDVFYSQVSSFISQHGVESCSIDWSNQTSSIGLMPYHYIELWLNGLIVSITGLISINVYFYITTGLIFVLLYQAILMIASKILSIPLKFKHKTLAIAVIFIGNIFFGFISSSMLSRGLGLYLNNKIVIVFVVFAVAWLKWKEGKYSVFFLVLLIAPLVNYGLMPVIVTTVPTFFVFHRWVFKMPEKIPYGRILLYYTLFTILLFGIQTIFPNQYKGGSSLGFQEVISYYNEFSKIKTLLNYIYNYVLQAILVLLPYIIFVIPLKKYFKHIFKNSIILLMSMFLISALALSSLLYLISESSQIYTITLNVIIHLFLYIGIFLLFFKTETHFIYKSLISIYLLSGLFMEISSLRQKDNYMDRYSANFLKDVFSVSSQIHGMGIRYLTPDYYKSAYNIEPNCNFEGYYLSYLKNNVVIHTVTVNQIPDKKELHDFFNYNKKIILKSSFYLYCINNAGLNGFNDEIAQLYFIKNNSIDFIVATKNAHIPLLVKNLVYKEVLDTSSGEMLLLIDRKRIQNEKLPD